MHADHFPQLEVLTFDTALHQHLLQVGIVDQLTNELVVLGCQTRHELEQTVDEIRLPRKLRLKLFGFLITSLLFLLLVLLFLSPGHTCAHDFSFFSRFFVLAFDGFPGDAAVLFLGEGEQADLFNEL